MTWHVERPRDYEPDDPIAAFRFRDPHALAGDLARLEAHYRSEQQRLRAEAREAGEAAAECRRWRVDLTAGRIDEHAMQDAATVRALAIAAAAGQPVSYAVRRAAPAPSGNGDAGG